jgi:hypothetical protein
MHHGTKCVKRVIMRNSKTILLAIVSLLLAVGCRVESGPEAKTTAGYDYQVVVLCDDEVWQGELADAVCDLLEEDIPGLVRPEGYFDIVKQVSSKEATDIEKRHGILLSFNILPLTEEASYSITNDTYAQPQLVINIKAANVEQAVEVVKSNAEELREVMIASEREEYLNGAKRKPAKQLMEDFTAATGHTMLIPANFSKANPADESLTWYIRDYKNKAQYIFAFTMEYDAELGIQATSADIVNAINAKFNTISSKDVSGSRMQVNTYRDIVADIVEVNDYNLLELRGCWEVSTDYMGGSFTSYTIFDPETATATVIVFALYAPEDSHRRLMHEMEDLIYTLE